MKNIFLILILFVSVVCISQKQKCTIYLVDGTTKEGISRFKVDDNVKFRETEDSEAEIIPKEKIEKIKLDEEGSIYTFRYKETTDGDGLWLKEIAVGEVCLYTNKIPGAFYGMSAGTSAGFGGGGMMMMGGNEVIQYYVCHKAATAVLKIASIGSIGKNFKKTASEFFKDCPKLVEKIQSKEYQKDNIESVVWFYNTNCVAK